MGACLDACAHASISTSSSSQTFMGGRQFAELDDGDDGEDDVQSSSSFVFFVGVENSRGEGEDTNEG